MFNNEKKKQEADDKKIVEKKEVKIGGTYRSLLTALNAAKKPFKLESHSNTDVEVPVPAP